MFATGFQSIAFQTPANDNPIGNGGGGKQEVWVTPYQLLQQQEYREKLIRKEKTELEKLESVLAENRRKAELAAKNKEIAASKQRVIALARAEAEYLAEINRLLMVRAELMQRIKENESILIILMVMRRRRLRVA